VTPVTLASAIKAAGVRSAYAAAWVQQVAGFAFGGLTCFASMARLAGQIGCSARTGFRIQAALLARGLVHSDFGARDKRLQPEHAKFREVLKNQGYAVRRVGGLLTALMESQRAEWRRKKDAKDQRRIERTRDKWREHNQRPKADERPRRQYPDFDRSPPPEGPREAVDVPAEVWTALGVRAPKPKPA